MNSVEAAAIWAGAVVVIFGLILFVLGRPLAEVFRAHRDRIKVDGEQNRAVALERQAEAKLALATTDERAELRKAELRRKAAEEDAAAEVARSTMPEQVVAQKRVIEAEAEGRAEAAKLRALRGEDGSAAVTQQVLEAYETFRKGLYNDEVTLATWMQGLEVVDGQLRRVRS